MNSFTVFCQVFEWPTQRFVSISPSIVIGAKRLTKLEKDHASYSAIFLTVGELHGSGLAALAYEIKTYEILFCGLFGQVYKISHYTVYDQQTQLSFNNYCTRYVCAVVYDRVLHLLYVRY